MANIQNELNNIKTALYGKDVRNSIHDAIKTCYDDASVNNDNANMEVKLARGTHNTLNDRLCEVDEKQNSLSLQLEHNVYLKSKQININDFDEETRNIFLENNSSVDVNYVLGKGNVLPRNTSFFHSNKNIFSSSFVVGKIDEATGLETHHEKFYKTSFMDVEPNQNYITWWDKQLQTYTGALLTVYFYDKKGNFISSVNTGSVNINGNKFNTPDNTYFIKLGYYFAETNTASIVLNLKIQIEKGSEKTDYVQHNYYFNDKYLKYDLEYIQNSIEIFNDKYLKYDLEYMQNSIETLNDNPLKNKKVVWFGTSIPDGRCSGTSWMSYPELIGKDLGIEVINESVGSSCVHKGNYKSLVSTYSEKQNEGYYDTLSEENKEIAKNTSLDYKIDKYLNSSEFPDLFVFDHGYNDAGYYGIDEYKNDLYNKENFIGAMNFIIRRIKEYNSDAKILIVGHFSNKTYLGGKNKDKDCSLVCEAQEIVSNIWNIPLIKLWEKTDLSEMKIRTTGYWKPVTSGGNSSTYAKWVENGDVEQEITIRDRYLFDGVHPHTDYEGKAIFKIANLLKDDIKKCLLNN